jgi:hypothetical protein
MLIWVNLFLSLFSGVAVSQAQAQILLFSKPGEQKVMLRTQSRLYGDLHEGFFNATIPLFQNSNEVWNLNLQAADIQIQQPGMLPNEGGVAGNSMAVPDHFWNVGGGIQYTRSLDATRFWSGSFSVASPSNRPFSSGRVIDYVGNLFYGFPATEKANWVLLLNYSNNRPILNGIPLPGFAYSYTPSKEFRVTAGFPFLSVYYEFAPRFSVQAYVVGVSILKTELAYQLFGPAALYLGIDFNQEVYLRDGRTRTTDRFFYAEKKLMIGVRSPLNHVLFADLFFGMSFDRSYFEVEKFSDRDQNERTLSKSGVAGLSLGARF